MQLGSTVRTIIGLGRSVAMATLLLLVLVQLANVVARYVFGASFIWVQELAIYFHAATIALACGATLLVDKHVRVDAIYNRFTASKKRSLDRLGFVAFGAPMLAAILYLCVPYVIHSWQILEASAEVSGLPGLFLIKSLLILLGVLLALAGLVSFLRPKAG